MFVFFLFSRLFFLFWLNSKKWSVFSRVKRREQFWEKQKKTQIMYLLLLIRMIKIKWNMFWLLIRQKQILSLQNLESRNENIRRKFFFFVWTIFQKQNKYFHLQPAAALSVVSWLIQLSRFYCFLTG